MSADILYEEPLRDLAAQAYKISNRLCGACRDLHSLWPYIRLSRASTGVELQESKLEIELRNLFDCGLRRVLIAGCQDTGLLATVARAGANRGTTITVLDICETPLELCRRVARRWSLSIKTLRQDLVALDIEQEFDVVLIHGTLHFISGDRRLRALTCTRRAIRFGGRLVLFFNTSRSGIMEIPQSANVDYGDYVLAELKRLNIPLPDSEPVLRQQLNEHHRRRQAREGAFANPKDIELLLDAAGFKLKTCNSIEVNVSAQMQELIQKISKRRFMAIAEIKSAEKTSDSDSQRPPPSPV